MKSDHHRYRALLFVSILLVAQGWSAALFAQYDDGARYAFTSSAANKSVQIIDIYKHKVVESIQLQSVPDVVIASNQLKALIVPHKEENRLTLIDLEGRRLAQINYPLTITPEETYLSPLGDSLAIYDQSAGILEVHALKRKVVLLRAENVRSGGDLTFNLDGSSLFWTDQHSGELKTIDLWEQTRSISLAKPDSKLSAMTRSTDGRLGFVSISDRNAVAVVDLQALKLIAEIPVGADPGRPWGTADGQYMLIPNTKDKTVSTISTLSLSTLYTVPGVSEPVSINPGWLDSVAAVVGRTGALVFLEISTGERLASKTLGVNTSEGVVTSDSKTLTVTSAGTVAFFDMRRQSLLSKIENLPEDISNMSLAVSNNLCH